MSESYSQEYVLGVISEFDRVIRKNQIDRKTWVDLLEPEEVFPPVTLESLDKRVTALEQAELRRNGPMTW